MIGLPSIRAGLVRLSVAVAQNDAGKIEEVLRGLDASECDLAAVDEAILQLYLFVGYPATLTTARMWREISGRAAVEADPSSLHSTVEEWVARGEKLCREIYGPAYGRLRSNVAELHPALDRWMVMEGYGKVLGRPGLSLGDRELCIVGVLASGGWKQQLHSHLRGALRCGVPSNWVEQALEIGLENTEPGLAGQLRELWSDIRASTSRDKNVH